MVAKIVKIGGDIQKGDAIVISDQKSAKVYIFFLDQNYNDFI